MSTDKSNHYTSSRSIAKSAGTISAATFISRILGFARDITIARLFGIHMYAQAFALAFKIPNLFRDLLGEGAANAAVVPVLSEYALKHSKEDFWELVNVLLNILLVILVALVLIGVLVSPLIVRLIAPGFIAFPQKLMVTIRLTRIIFPYILLISLAAYAMSILNSLKHFSVPAFAPCLLNISIIVFVILFGEGIKGLAIGVLVGGILQLGIQVAVLYKKGFRLRPVKQLSHPAVKTIGRLMLPRTVSSAVYQVNNFVDSIFGSLAWIVGEGAVAVLYFSYRLIQFPLGIFSNALAQALLPTFSAQALEEGQVDLKQTLSWGVRAAFFVLIPASAGFIVLSGPVVSVLFAGGRFDEASVRLTANALLCYSIGLFAYGTSRILQACFFALKDTVTPAKVAGLALAVNIILNAALMFPFKIAGIALATSVSGINTFVILFILLKKRIGDFGVKEIAVSFVRILSASICMSLTCYLIFERGIFSNKIINLAAAIIAGFASYIIFCFIFKVREIREFQQWIRESRIKTYEEPNRAEEEN